MLTVSNVEFAWPGASRACLSIGALNVAAGETLFLQGPSGSGKSTLLNLLAGVLLPQKGFVAVNGVVWSDMPGSHRDAFRADHIGYIFQQFNLVPYLSVRENVLLPCRFSISRANRARAQGGSIDEQAAFLLNHMELDATTWDRSAAKLSVGQQQRVAAARALIGHPRLVIADEPTSALDLDVRERFMQLLLGQCRTHRTTLVFVSHDARLSQFFDRSVSLADLPRARSSKTTEAAV